MVGLSEFCKPSYFILICTKTFVVRRLLQEFTTVAAVKKVKQNSIFRILGCLFVLVADDSGYDNSTFFDALEVGQLFDGISLTCFEVAFGSFSMAPLAMTMTSMSDFVGI